jgi:hypothetical protein
LDYQPVSYIVGTTLPDTAGAAQNGTITWGANPTGIVITMGSLLFDSDDEDTGASPPDALYPVNPDLNPGGDTSYQGTNVFMYSFFHDVSTQTETPMTFIWTFFAITLVLILFALGYKYSQNMMIGAGCLVFGFGICVGLALLPKMFVALAVAICLPFLIMERSPSL